MRPHPHINLATVTYLFEGSLMHRDRLGSVQEILPGAERALYSLTAGLSIDNAPLEQHQLAVLAAGQSVEIMAKTKARCIEIAALRRCTRGGRVCSAA